MRLRGGQEGQALGSHQHPHHHRSFPSVLRTSVLSTYHRLANADARLGDGLGGLVFKAFWKRGGMPPFPGLQRELIGDFKCLSER